MGFMQLQVEYFAAYHVETTRGTEIVPCHVVGGIASADELADYIAGEPLGGTDGTSVSPWAGVERREGWYARYSAPGYLDCTEWLGPYETADGAAEDCRAMYGDDDDDDSAEAGT